MQQHIQSLVKHLFQKDTLQEVTEDELRSFTETHPYSAIGQFLFAKKLQDIGSDQLELQAEKASLYFHNPTWTSWLLTGDQMTWEPPQTVKETAQVTTIEEPAPIHISEPAETTIEEETAPIHVPEPPVAVQEEEQPPVEQQIEIPAETKEQPLVAEHPQSTEEQTATSEEESTCTQEPITSPTVAGQPAPQQEEELVFQSYHTIDYFASQGIKLKPEDFTKDRFGKQLKSFTEWLRSMKRATPATLNEEMDDASRQAIQKHADHSIEGKEAETEAMAEVWAKQGNIAKAIDVYSKLSLLNPAKRAYFAARIEQLKES